MRHLNLASALSVAALIASTFGALAGDAALPNLTTRACAERDLQFVMLIERHGEAQDIRRRRAGAGILYHDACPQGLQAGP